MRCALCATTYTRRHVAWSPELETLTFVAVRRVVVERFEVRRCIPSDGQLWPSSSLRSPRSVLLKNDVEDDDDNDGRADGHAVSPASAPTI
jgi:hypothetical protein